MYVDSMQTKLNQIQIENDIADRKRRGTWGVVTLRERLNVITDSEADEDIYRCRENKVKINARKVVNFYDTLCLYCAENDISLTNLTSEDFHKTSNCIADFAHRKSGKHDHILCLI